MDNDSQQFKQAIAGVFTRASALYDHVGPNYFSYFGRQLVETANIPVGAKVLDVATGRGAVLFPAAEKVGEQGYVNGIDISAGMVKETSAEIEQRRLKNVSLQMMDAEQLTFPDASFDMLVLGFSLFFYPHLEQTLAEFKRVLKPGGKIAVSTWGNADERWLWTFDVARKYQPLQAQSPKVPVDKFNTAAQMQQVMSRAGFKDIQITEETVEFVYADGEEWLASQWSHGTRSQWEALEPAIQEQWKSELLEGLRAMKRPDGLPQTRHVLYTVATKP